MRGGGRDPKLVLCHITNIYIYLYARIHINTKTDTHTDEIDPTVMPPPLHPPIQDSPSSVWYLHAETPAVASRWARILTALIAEKAKASQLPGSTTRDPLLMRADALVSAGDAVVPYDSIEETLLQEYDQATLEAFEEEVRARAAAAEAGQTAILDGAWFVKKAESFGKSHRRWFELRGSILTYYARVERGHGADSRGALDIVATTVITSEDRVLLITNTERAWQLTADTSVVAKAWEARLVAVRAKRAELFDARLATLAAATPVPSFADVKQQLVEEFGDEAFTAAQARVVDLLAARAPLPGPSSGSDTNNASVETKTTGGLPGAAARGWFVKQAEKRGQSRRRYFELHGMEILYFVDTDIDSVADQLGAIAMSPATLIAAAGTQLTLTNPDRVWALTADTAAQAAEWEGVLFGAQAAEHASFQSRLAALLAAAAPTPPDFGTLKTTLVGEFGQDSFDHFKDTVIRAIDQATASARESAPQTPALESATVPDVPAAPVIPAAWFVKKAEKRGRDQRRFFELHGTELRYFEGEEEGRGDGEQKGSVELLAESRVASTGATLTIVNPDREWHLTAEGGPVVATQWEALLLRAIDAFKGAVHSRAEALAASGNLSYTDIKAKLTSEFGTVAFDAEQATVVAAVKDVELQRPALSPAAIAPAVAQTTPSPSASAVQCRSVDGIPYVWMLKKPEKRGKAQRRFFELHGTELRYYEDESGGHGRDQKGAVELGPDSRVTVADRDLTITNPDRVWALVTDTAEEATQWAALLKRAQQAADSEFRAEIENIIATAATTLSFADLKTQLISQFGEDSFEHNRRTVVDTLRDAELARRGSTSTPLAIAKLRGWFTKKAEKRGRDRRRFFELHAAELRYFEDQADDQGVVLKGTIVLDARTEVRATGRALTIKAGERTYELLAETEGQAAQWEGALLDARPRLALNFAAQLSSLLPADRAPPTFRDLKRTLVPAYGVSAFASQRVQVARAHCAATATWKAAHPDTTLPLIPSAWFTKEAEKRGKAQRRFLELHGAEIKYFREQVAGRGDDPRGSILVLPITGLRVDGLRVVLENPDRTWELTAESLDTADDWEGLLAGVIVRLEDGMMTRLQALLEHRSTQTFASLRHALVEEFGEAAFEAFEPRMMDEIKLRSVALGDEEGDEEGDEDAALLAAAWFVKANRIGIGRRRFCELFATEVRVFVSAEGGRGVGLKGNVDILPATTVAASAGVLTITTGRDTDTLTSDAAQQAEEWVVLIRRAVENAVRDAALQVADADEMDLYPGHGGWFLKRGRREGPQRIGRNRRRYCTLLYGRQTRTYRFAYFEGVDGTVLRDRAGFILVTRGSTVVRDGRHLCIVRHHVGRALERESWDGARQGSGCMMGEAGGRGGL